MLFVEIVLIVSIKKLSLQFLKNTSNKNKLLIKSIKNGI